MEVTCQADELIEAIRHFGNCIVAFSGGVDSGVVAAAAFLALGDKAVAITGVGPAVSQADLEAAKATAAKIGIRHILLNTEEIHDPNYQRNDGRRCYYCKSNLYAALRAWANDNDFDTIASGTNIDDLGDYRPGLDAAAENLIRSPLVDLKIGKDGVRKLAKLWDLPVADRPASPCLASRIAYGESVTTRKLSQLESAERWLTNRGFEDVRVRLHPGSLARVEVSIDEIGRFADSELREAMLSYFKEIGFAFVTLDLNGRRSGSLNMLLPVLNRVGKP